MGHLGKQTITYKTPPVITGAYSNVGPKEGKGPMGKYFDHICQDELLGEDSWEKAEAR
ncbi:MAG: stage V sporulation protein AD, partial [Cellulosilyticum sp.]|nr:stage V sporulation protein AD [Cellulosilyticum sp.]